MHEGNAHTAENAPNLEISAPQAAADGNQPAVTFDDILSVLERRTEINVLSALIQAVKMSVPTAILANSAIIIDANAVLRIPGHKKSSDIIDYIGAVHPRPVILPGQVVQEFWNNQLNAVATVYKTIKHKYNDLDKEVFKALEVGVSGIESIGLAVGEFKKDNEHLFDADLVQKTTSFLEQLSASALVPHAPRTGLKEIAIQRKMSKTPPGFKDDGDGDFLVWIDALWGLCNAKQNGKTFDSVILLSNDKKPDWCRGHTAHPVLYAEIRTLLDVHFEVWTLDYFAQAIS